MANKIIYMSFIGALLVSTAHASNNKLFEEAEKQINKMQPGEDKCLAREIFSQMKVQEGLDPLSFTEMMSQFGVKLDLPIEENNNQINVNQPIVNIIENNTNEVNENSSESKLKDICISKLNLMWVDDETAKLYIGHLNCKLNSEEAYRTLVENFNTICPAVATEENLKRFAKTKKIEIDLNIDNKPSSIKKPIINIIENNENNANNQVQNLSLDFLPLEKKFELLGFMKVDLLEDNTVYGQDPKTEEGLKNIISMQMYCALMLDEKIFEMAKKENIFKWNAELKKHNENGNLQNQMLNKELEEKKLQEQKRLEEELRQQEEEKRLYKEKVEKFVFKCDTFLNDARSKIFQKIKSESKGNFKTLEMGMIGFNESSQSVTHALKNTDFFNNIKDIFSQLGIQMKENNDEVIKEAIKKAQGGNKNYTTLEKVNQWFNSEHYQTNYVPDLMNAIRLVYAVTGGNMTELVERQQNACANGLNGRALWYLMELLEGEKDKVKSGEKKL